MTRPAWQRAVAVTERARRGLANERTVLSWSRSALSLAAIGALILRFGTEHHVYALAYPVGSGVVLAAAAAWVYWNTIYSSRRKCGRDFVVEPRALWLLAVTTAVVGVVSLLIALLS